jgi:hypothetical protein
MDIDLLVFVADMRLLAWDRADDINKKQMEH